MTLQQLKYVVVTEECGSISDAAEQLFIAQPSLSKSIRLLEEELGFALFVRERKGVKATAVLRKAGLRAKRPSGTAFWKRTGKGSLLQKKNPYLFPAGLPGYRGIFCGFKRIWGFRIYIYTYLRFSFTGYRKCSFQKK